MQIGWFILNTGSFSEVWNFCACQAEGPRVASPRGKLGMLSLRILTGRKQSQVMSNLVSGLWGVGWAGGWRVGWAGELSTGCGSLEARASFPANSTLESFPFLKFCFVSFYCDAS